MSGKGLPAGRWITDRWLFNRRVRLTACTDESRQGNVRERSSIGAMEEVSRKVQKASTHSGGCVRVDVAVVEVDGAAGDVDASPLRAER